MLNVNDISPQPHLIQSTHSYVSIDLTFPMHQPLTRKIEYTTEVIQASAKHNYLNLNTLPFIYYVNAVVSLFCRLASIRIIQNHIHQLTQLYEQKKHQPNRKILISDYRNPLVTCFSCVLSSIINVD